MRYQSSAEWGECENNPPNTAEAQALSRKSLLSSWISARPHDLKPTQFPRSVLLAYRGLHFSAARSACPERRSRRFP